MYIYIYISVFHAGAFGYLSIFDDYGDAVGNFGFRDQQMALRWVKNNIANFKGDPNRVRQLILIIYFTYFYLYSLGDVLYKNKGKKEGNG